MPALQTRPAETPCAREPWLLPNGYRASVRMLSPASKPLLAAAMARLSPESSRRRFHLSERELAHLTAIDGVRHVAFGVCGRGPAASCGSAR